MLLVEDDDDTRDKLTDVLEARGARVTAAASAREALEAIDRGDADVLVSEFGMPDEDA